MGEGNHQPAESTFVWVLSVLVVARGKVNGVPPARRKNCREPSPQIVGVPPFRGYTRVVLPKEFLSVPPSSLPLPLRE